MVGEDGAQFARVETKLDYLTSEVGELRKDMRTMREQALDRRVTSVEENIKWIVRSLVVTVLGMVSAIAVGFVK